MEQFSHRDMIDLFLDGQLPVELRNVFFAVLAASEELQADFHRAVSIHAAAHRHAQALHPPPALTASILATAGSQTSVPRTRSGPLSTNAFRTIALTATATVAGFFIGWLSTRLPPSTTPPMHPGTAVAVQKIEPEFPAAPQSTRGVYTFEQSASTAPMVPRPSITGEYIASPSLAVPSIFPAMPLPAPALPVDCMARSPRPTAAKHSRTTSEHPSAKELLSQRADKSEGELIFSVRQTMPLALRQQRFLSPLNSSPLNNTLFAVEYREHAVSILAQWGYEQFPIYEVTTAADGTTQHTLRQLLWWVGGGMRVYAPRAEEGLFRSLRPMAGIVLGTSQYGVLARGELGLSWEWFPDISLQFLLEGMVHSHGIGTNWEHAEKLSASVGLAFRF